MNKIKKINEELFRGDKVIESSYTPKMKWKGSKIPFELLEEIKSFFLWTHQTHKQEAMVKLFYSHKEKEWLVFVPMQEGSFASCNEIDSEENKRQRIIEIPADYMLMGSIHHHSTMSAFASSIDERDEKNIPGLHITFGELDNNLWELHARVSFQNYFYECDLSNWIKSPYAKNKEVSNILMRLKPKYFQFNTTWKDRIKEKVFGLNSLNNNYMEKIIGTNTGSPNLKQPKNYQYDIEDIDNEETHEIYIREGLKVLISIYNFHPNDIISEIDMRGKNHIFENDIYADSFEEKKIKVLRMIVSIMETNDIEIDELFDHHPYEY